jgi:hypothetical protein
MAALRAAAGADRLSAWMAPRTAPAEPTLTPLPGTLTSISTFYGSSSLNWLLRAAPDFVCRQANKVISREAIVETTTLEADIDTAGSGRFTLLALFDQTITERVNSRWLRPPQPLFNNLHDPAPAGAFCVRIVSENIPVKRHVPENAGATPIAPSKADRSPST